MSLGPEHEEASERLRAEIEAAKTHRARNLVRGSPAYDVATSLLALGERALESGDIVQMNLAVGALRDL